MGRGSRRRYSRVEQDQHKSGIVEFVDLWHAMGCGRPPLAKGDWFSEVANTKDQLDNDEWDSEDDLPADFVVANDPPVERENPEDTPRILYAAADNTFSVIITGEMAIDIPHGTDISHLGLTEVLDAPDVSFLPANSTRRARRPRSRMSGALSKGQVVRG